MKSVDDYLDMRLGDRPDQATHTVQIITFMTAAVSG